LQASVNPKAETVEELQGRRKALHLGMCKLLREDLALKAEQRLADRRADADVSGTRDRVVTEFDQLMRAHEEEDAGAFNSDERYKALMTEAIDGKAHALLKLDVYLESAAAGADAAALDRIRDAALADFANPAAELRLRTGVTEFPWAAVVEKQSPEIDLGEWDAAAVKPQALKSVAAALGGNAIIRAVTVRGVKLALREGWATTQLEDAALKEAVRAVPATVALVLRSCWGLTNLDLRCDGSGWARAKRQRAVACGKR
jgi:hypothetical protein